MKRSFLLAGLFFSLMQLQGQGCFFPNDGDTLFTTTNTALYSDTTGFVTFPNTNGNWSITNTTGTAMASFTDNTGGTSTLGIGGTGTITVQNDTTNLTIFGMGSCVQSFNLVNYVPNVATNPVISGPCPLNLVLVIDESASIEANMSTQIIRDAIMQLASGLAADPNGHTMAIVEFDTRAQNVVIGSSSGLQTIDANYLTNLNDYLTNDYDPPSFNISTLSGGTNWEDALTKADLITGANLIMMITDGRPTFYTVNGVQMGIAGEGLVYDLTALKQAQDVANTIKSKGKHLFISGINFPSDIQTLIDISGPNEFQLGGDVSTLLSSDYSLVNPDDLVALLTQASQFCLPPAMEDVPTMGEWALIILGLLMMIVGVVAVRKNSIKMV